jgi:drug/metabolite transporter (DMT)-like permease
MTVRVVAWLGGVLFVLAMVSLGGYFAAVGLDEADKVASVIGAFVGLVGLVLAGYGTVLARRGTPSPPQPGPSAGAALGARIQQNSPSSGGTVNAVQDGTMHIHHHTPPTPGGTSGHGQP